MIKVQFFRFIIVGVFSTIINYSAFYILYSLLSIDYLFASAVGFVSGVFAGYGFNKIWTFQVVEKSKKYIVKYYLVYVISLFLGLAFLKFLVVFLAIDPRVANFLTIILTTCTNFIGIKLWVFQK